MEIRHAIFIVAFILSVPAGTLIALNWKVARDAFLFLLVSGTLVTEYLDINFISRETYRGSTRGIEISFVDILGIILLLTCLLSNRAMNRKLFWPGSLALVIVYYVYCCFSVATSDPQIFGVFELTKIPRGVLIFLAIAWTVRGRDELNIIVLGVAGAVFFGSAIALEQRYIGGFHRVYGPMSSFNEFSQYNSIAGPVLAAAVISNLPFFTRLIAGIGSLAAGVCVMLTISRTGAATYAIVIFGVMAYGTRAFMLDYMAGKVRITTMGVVCVLILGLGTLGIGVRAGDTIMARFGRVTLTDEYVTNDKGRGMYFRLARLVVQDHFFGVGLNNWSYIITRDYYPRLGIKSVPYTDTDVSFAGLTKNEVLHMIAPPAHNLGLLTLGELGYPGFVIFGLVWARWFQMGFLFLWKRSNDIMVRFGVGAFFGISGSFLHNFTEYGFRHTSIFFLMHVLIGALASLYYQQKTQPDRWT